MLGAAVVTFSEFSPPDQIVPAFGDGKVRIQLCGIVSGVSAVTGKKDESHAPDT